MWPKRIVVYIFNAVDNVPWAYVYIMVLAGSANYSWRLQDQFYQHKYLGRAINILWLIYVSIKEARHMFYILSWYNNSNFVFVVMHVQPFSTRLHR